MTPIHDTTQLTSRLAGGEESAAAALLPLIYDELRALAARYLRRERPGHTLQPTALVHEVYLRMVNADAVEFRGRAQFFALAARQIRKILVDHARKRGTVKRGGNVGRVMLGGEEPTADQAQVDLIALDAALAGLAERSSRQAHVVEMRFFAGMSVEEVADVLGVSAATVKNDWAFARAWLRREMGGGGS